MIPELGHFALILALLVALVQGVLPLIGAQRRDAGLMALARPAARVQFVLVALAFGCLAYSFAASDFSVINVAEHSNTQLPLHYRIAATWGSHEGSLLLWVLMLTGWATAVTFRSRNLPSVLLARVLAVMGLVSVGFLLFLLFTSNPFLRLIPAAAEGADLNPLLQDPGMVIHPPMLYMGYVGFSVAFSFAIAALLGGRLDATWARWSRPWTIAAWSFLTMGIALGSWWAYYELGWGGWWFWDPVENASFMPWLVGTALAAFARGHRKARHVQELDGAARDRRLFLVAARDISRSVGRTHFGARVCHGSGARRIHSRVPGIGDRRLADALRNARRRSGGRRGLCDGLARVRAAGQQHPARGGVGRRVPGNDVPDVPRRTESPQSVSRPAVFQFCLPDSDGTRGVPDGHRPDCQLASRENCRIWLRD